MELKTFDKQEEMNKIVSRLSIEVIYGCDTMDNKDLFDWITDAGIDPDAVMDATLKEIHSNEKRFHKESYSDEFLTKSFRYWFYWFNVDEKERW